MRYLLYIFTAYFVLGLGYCFWNAREVAGVPFLIYITGTGVFIGLCAIEHAARRKQPLS